MTDRLNTINLELNTEDYSCIFCAANIQNRDIKDFIVELAKDGSYNVLMSQARIELPNINYVDFQNTLTETVELNQDLTALFYERDSGEGIKPVVDLSNQAALAAINCEVDELNTWLKALILDNNEKIDSKTYVVYNKNQVVGYYVLRVSEICRGCLMDQQPQYMPKSIPVILLSCLVINSDYQQSGLDIYLLKNALTKCITVTKKMGSAAILVLASSEKARNFYLKYGFEDSPIDPMILSLSMKKLMQHRS